MEVVHELSILLREVRLLLGDYELSRGFLGGDLGLLIKLRGSLKASLISRNEASAELGFLNDSCLVLTLIIFIELLQGFIVVLISLGFYLYLIFPAGYWVDLQGCPSERVPIGPIFQRLFHLRKVVRHFVQVYLRDEWLHFLCRA